MEVLLRLLQDYSITPTVIDEIELSVPTAVASLVNRPATSANRAAMLGSGQYVMAATAITGKMDLKSFDDRLLQSNEVKGLMGKVKVSGEIESDGSSPTGEIIIPKGEKENPMSVQEVEEKFLSLAAPVLGDAEARSVIGAVQALADRDSLSELLALLKVST